MSCNPQVENTVPAISVDSSVMMFSDSPKRQKHTKKPSNPISLGQDKRPGLGRSSCEKGVRILAKVNMWKHYSVGAKS